MKKPAYASLIDGVVYPTDDINTLENTFSLKNSRERIVGRTRIGKVEVSTVFLGINHGFVGNRNLWFETMVFGGRLDGYQERYETLIEAKFGHKIAVGLVDNPWENFKFEFAVALHIPQFLGWLTAKINRLANWIRKKGK